MMFLVPDPVLFNSAVQDKREHAVVKGIDVKQVHSFRKAVKQHGSATSMG